MRRWMCVAWLLACALHTLTAHATNGDSRSDYAGSIPLEIAGSAAHHRVELPVSIYAGVRRADLADLRVVNGAGEFVPYAVIGGREQPPANPVRHAGAVFPLRAEAGTPAAQVDVDVTQRADGSVVSVRTRATTTGSTGAQGTPPKTIAYIVDLSKVDSPIAALRPVWKEVPDNFIGNARVEASDDLRSWRGVSTSPLAYLRQGDARLVEDRIEFAPTRMRYVRIGFSDGAPEMVGLDTEAPRERPEIPRTSVRVAGKPMEKPGEFEFDLDVRAPVDRVRIIVPELNALAPVRLDSRPDARAEWRPVVSTVAYRMMRDSLELASPAIPVAPNPSPRWRAVVDQTAGGFGRKPPELEASWPAATLVFLARGSGPFALLYGARDAGPAALPIATLVPGYRDGTEQSFPVAKLGTATGGRSEPSVVERAIDTATMGEPRKAGLWALLIIGVIVLALMAWRLSRQMRPGTTSGDDPPR